MLKDFEKTCRAPLPDALIVSLTKPGRLVGQDTTPDRWARGFSKGDKLDVYCKGYNCHALGFEIIKRGVGLKPHIL